MVVYHLLFDCLMFGWRSWGFLLSWPIVLLERFIAYSFILCAGFSAVYSHHNIRRGIITELAGALVIIASFVVSAPILFGVLQFLGVAMILYGLVGRWIEKIPELVAPILWIVLFVGTTILTNNVRVEVKWLFWLGFSYPGFVSYDYFPVMPYIFLFFLGSWIAREVKGRWSGLTVLTKKAPGWLTWPGRHTLWIYILHQPILYGACFLIYILMYIHGL